MNKSKKNLMKFKVIKEIMDSLYDSGGYVDKELVSSLLKRELDELRKLLREVKISGVFDENKKRD